MQIATILYRTLENIILMIFVVKRKGINSLAYRIHFLLHCWKDYFLFLMYSSLFRIYNQFCGFLELKH